MDISYIFAAEVKFGQQSMLLYIIYTAQYMYQKSYFSQDNASSAFDFGTNINFAYFNRRSSQSYTEQSKKFCYFPICLVSLNILDTSYLNTCTKILSL